MSRAPTSTFAFAPPLVRDPRRIDWTTHFWLPLAAALLGMAALQAGLDQALADALWRLQGGTWAWRDAPLLKLVMHRGGRTASILAWIALALASLATLRPAHARWRRPAAYVLVSVAAAALTISVLKAVTNIDCPWDMARYGGTHPWLGLLDARPAGLPRGRCFPSGHASAGYAWLALYFAARMAAPRLRGAALAIGLGAGLAFGIGQQLRGAHFASHDVASALTCWLVVMGIWRIWPWRRTP